MSGPKDPDHNNMVEIGKVNQSPRQNQETIQPEIQKVMIAMWVRFLSFDGEGRFDFECGNKTWEDLRAYNPDLRASGGELIKRAMSLAGNLGAYMAPISEQYLNKRVENTDELLRFICPTFYSKEKKEYSSLPVPVYFPSIKVPPEILNDDEEVVQEYLHNCWKAIRTLKRFYEDYYKNGEVDFDIIGSDLSVRPEVARRSLNRSGFALHLPRCYAGIDAPSAKKHAKKLEDYMFTPADPLAALISAAENYDLFSDPSGLGQMFYGTKKRVHIVSRRNSKGTEVKIEKPNKGVPTTVSPIGLIFQRKT